MRIWAQLTEKQGQQTVELETVSQPYLFQKRQLIGDQETFTAVEQSVHLSRGEENRTVGGIKGDLDR